MKRSPVLSLPPPSTPSSAPSAERDVFARLQAKFPGRTAAVTSLVQTLIGGLPAVGPILLHGRPGSGKTAFVSKLLNEERAPPHAFVSAAACATTRDLFETALRGLARALVRASMTTCDAGADAGATTSSAQQHRDALSALMRRLCSPERGRAGWGAAAALVAWADTPAHMLRNAYVEAMLLASSAHEREDDAEGKKGAGVGSTVGAGAGAGAGAGVTVGATVGVARSDLLSRAFLHATLPAARATTLAEFTVALSAFGGLTCGDVGLGGAEKWDVSLGDGAAAVARAWPAPLWLVIDDAERFAAAQPRLLQQFLDLRENVRQVFGPSSPSL